MQKYSEDDARACVFGLERIQMAWREGESPAAVRISVIGGELST